MPVHYNQHYCAFITLDRPGGAARRPWAYHQVMLLLLLLTSFLPGKEGKWGSLEEEQENIPFIILRLHPPP